MRQTLEIKLECQSGGWVWAAISTQADGGASIVLTQSSEAFSTEDAARRDAERALSDLQAGLSQPFGSLG